MAAVRECSCSAGRFLKPVNRYFLKRGRGIGWFSCLLPGSLLPRIKQRNFTASYNHLVLICGHYEGVDHRVEEHLADELISIGDYVLTGGELGAMVISDAVARMVPGVLGDAGSAAGDSFYEPILEYPQYTKPVDYRGWKVPEILVSGHHANIARWRRKEALRRTLKCRP